MAKALSLMVYLPPSNGVAQSIITCSNKDLICLELEGDVYLAQQQDTVYDEESDEQLYYCVICGIPAEWSKHDLVGFIEPYLFDIENVYICTQPRSKIAALGFEDKGTLNNFVRTYDGMHYPTHPHFPPVLIAKITHVHIEEKHEIDTKAGVSEPEEQVTWAEEKADTPEKNKQPPSVSSPLILLDSRKQLNEEDCAEELDVHTPGPTRWVETSAGRDRFSPIGAYSNRPILLPTCATCLRRIDGKCSGLDSAMSSVEAVETPNADRCNVCALYADTSNTGRRCRDCNLQENLWACMTCAHVGCGRYTRDQHAKKHFHDSLHSFCLELATGRIWDYVSDTFVHVLQQPEACSNRTDEYLLTSEKPRDAWEGLESELNDMTLGKISNLVKEYDVFLANQLEQQRLFYEQEIAKARVEAIQDSIQRACGGNITEEEMNAIEALKLEISSLEAEHEHLLADLRAIEDTARDVRRENQTLIKEQKACRERNAATHNRTQEIRTRCDAQVFDLEEQVRDLEFCVRTRQKLEVSPLRDEVQSGVVLVQQGEEKQRGRRKPKPRRR